MVYNRYVTEKYKKIINIQQ